MNKIFRALVPVLSVAFLFGAYAPIAFADPTPTTLTIISPNGGEIWSGTHNITWSSTGGVVGDEVTLVWSTDNFVSTSNLIAENIPYSLGTYSWDTNTVADGTNYRVRVVAESNPSVFDSSNADFAVDNTAPTISSVSIPDVAMNIGDVVTATITVGNDAGVTYTLVSGTIDGFTLGSLSRTSATTYTATFTVASGGTDIAAGADVPVTGLILADTADVPNQSSTFTGAVSPAGASDSIDANVPTLSSVTIASNNASTTWAKTGDVVTVSFTSNESIGTPTVTIAGQDAVEAGGPTAWTATYTMQGTDDTGVVPFTIDFSDLATNAGVQVTTITSGLGVTFDKTNPSIAFTQDVEAGPVASDTVNLTVTETNADAATYFYGFSTDTVCDVTDTYSVIYASGTPFTLNTETNNTKYICAKAVDNAGNTGYSSASANVLNIDATSPVISSISMPTGTYKIGTTLTVTIGADAVGYTKGTIVVNGVMLSGSLTDNADTTYSINYTVSEGDTDVLAAGVPTASVTLKDGVLNENTAFTTVTESGGDVIIDAHKPTLSSVSIISSNASTTLAKTGDTITLSFTGNEALAEAANEPVVTIAGHPIVASDVNGSGTTWTATYTMVIGDTEGVVPFTVNFKDVALNAGDAVSAITSGSSVVFDRTAPSAPTVTSIAGDNYINNSEKAAVHVVGTAETNATVNVTLTGGAAVGPTPGTADGSGNFDITLDATGLTDGTITPTVNATDAAGNTSTNTTTPTATKDVVAPTVSSITTKDANTNGTVETATIVFSEAVKDVTFSAGDFSIGGTVATTFTSGTANDSTIDISHGGIAGTNVKDVLYAPGTVTDLAGNPLAAILTGTVSEVDAAGPVPLSAETITTTSIAVTFSEDINGSSDSPADFAVAGNSVTATAELGGVVTLTLGTPIGTGDTPLVTVHGDGATIGLKDLDDNWSPAEYTLTPVDGVPPTLSPVHIASNNVTTTLAKSGDVVSLTFTSSESVSTPTVTIDGQSASVSGGTTVWTATYTMTGTDTEGVIPFTINFSDLSSPTPNAGTQVTVVTDASSVFYDRTNPSVNAGTDKEVNATVAQDATTSDAGSGLASHSWTKISGPGTITFGTPTTVDTTISADTDGTYILRLTVLDAAGNSSSDEITFIWDTANPEPLTSSPSDGSTGVALASGTATVTYDEDIVLLDTTRVLLVNDSTGASYKGTVVVSGGNGNSAILNVPYSGLDYGTKYRINVKPNALEDVSGNNLATNFISYFTTTIDTVVPIVNSLSAGSITTTGATLSVTTDESATCKYATTDSSYSSMTAFDAPNTGTSHTVVLSGLTASTGYDYYVRCADTSAQTNTMTTSASVSFTTSAPASDSVAPPIPSITTGVATVNSDSYQISGTAGADTPTPTVRTVSVYNGATLVGTAVVPIGQTGWSVSVTLAQNSANSFTAVSADASGNVSSASSAVVITEDETAGADVTAPGVPAITTGPVIVDADTYEIVGTEASDGGVRTVSLFEDGAVIGTAVLPAGQTAWAITVTLLQNVANVITAKATDEAGNTSAASASLTITETTAADTTAPVISNIQAGSILQTGATIAWNTNENATSRVEYGTTSSYGSLTTVDGSADNTSHSVSLTGLTAGTEYHFRVISADSLGNVASSTDNTFVTAIDDTASLAVTGVDNIRSFATADNTFDNGWKWTFHVTVPTSETSFAMKFSDFLSGANVLSAATNIRYYTAQSSLHSASTTAVTIAGADTYPASIVLDSDLSAGTAGRQIDVTVEARVPSGTTGGSYSTSYGVSSGI